MLSSPPHADPPPIASRRMPGSASAPSSTISARPLRCCCFRRSACSASPGSASRQRALIFAPLHAAMARPSRCRPGTRLLLLGLGACLAIMNTSFYLALDRLPMSLVAAMEFVGTIGVALCGLRTARNVAALVARRARRIPADRREMVERSARPVLGLR